MVINTTIVKNLKNDDTSDSMSLVGDEHEIKISINGGGNVITTGEKNDYIRLPFNCEIFGWEVVADVSGSIVVDIWVDYFANFPPTVADSIAGGAKPQLSSQQTNSSATLTGWTTELIKGQYMKVNVDSVSTVTAVTVTLKVKRIE